MKWCKEKKTVLKAVKNSVSYAQILRKLGLKDTAGSNYSTLKRVLKRFYIPFIPTYASLPHAYGKYTADQLFKKVLIKNSTQSSTNNLKISLIREKIFKHKCYKCKRTKWNGKKIPIQLEHIDGDRTNNTIKNLTLLCPNCHAQTPTYCRGQGSYKTAMRKKEEKLVKKRLKLQKKLKLNVKEVKLKIKIQNIRKKLITNRLMTLRKINITKFGWVQKLASKWGVSHSQVKRFLKKYKPNIYLKAFIRKKSYK